MKRLLIGFFLVLCAMQGFATHIVGGEMTYEYIGKGLNPNTSNYKITLRLFRDELAGGDVMPTNFDVGIYGGQQQSLADNQPSPISKTREGEVP